MPAITVRFMHNDWIETKGKLFPSGLWFSYFKHGTHVTWLEGPVPRIIQEAVEKLLPTLKVDCEEADLDYYPFSHEWELQGFHE